MCIFILQELPSVPTLIRQSDFVGNKDWCIEAVFCICNEVQKRSKVEVLIAEIIESSATGAKSKGIRWHTTGKSPEFSVEHQHPIHI